jgi:hypothetical protein
VKRCQSNSQDENGRIDLAEITVNFFPVDAPEEEEEEHCSKEENNTETNPVFSHD